MTKTIRPGALESHRAGEIVLGGTNSPSTKRSGQQHPPGTWPENAVLSEKINRYSDLLPRDFAQSQAKFGAWQGADGVNDYLVGYAVDANLMITPILATREVSHE